MKPYRKVTVIAASLIMAGAVLAQKTPKSTNAATPAAPQAVENSGVQKTVHHSGPIVAKWTLKKLKGSANIEVNKDGTFLFSGQVNDKKPNEDFEISMALRNSNGGIYVFHWAGSADGAMFSKQGQSDFLKDDFKSFAGDVQWVGEWRTHLSKEGVAKAYEAKEKRKEALDKEKREKEEKAEAAKAKAAVGQSSGGGGGGGGIGSTIAGVAQTVSSVISTISSVGDAIASIF
jgi:hypothetical protein